MASPLEPLLRELLDGGAGEPLAGLPDGGRFLPLVTLESGQRIGLTAAATWIAVPAEGPPRPYAAEDAHIFYEVLEVKRADFESLLEEASRAAGLPPDDVVLEFPAAGVVRAVLGKGLPYMTRLALLWIRTTELRELRADILAVSRSPLMPVPIKELAEHLVVPE
jgi:hypothetical protein